MADASLKVILSAEGKQLAATMQKAEKDVQGLESELSSLPQSFEQVDKAVSKTSDSLKKAAAAAKPLTNAIAGVDKSLAKLPANTNRAGDSLNNLSRIVQDAPFGFIGISNNINPLLESFQRLKKETGSTGGAFKSLLSSLGGAGGLGLAVSAASSLLVLFGDRLFGASKKAKEADDSFNTMASHFADQAVKLTSLVGIVQNVNAKYDDKQKALAKINEEYKPYLQSLGIEQVSLGNIATAYDKIIDSMLRQAVVKGLQEEIGKAVEQTAKKIIKLQAAEEQRIAATEAATTAIKKQASIAEIAAQAQAAFNKPVVDGVLAQQRQEQATNALNLATNNYDSVLKRTKDQLMAQLKPLLNLTASYDDLGESIKQTSGVKTDIIARAKELAAFLKDAFVVTYEFSPVDSIQVAKAKAQAFVDQVSKGLKVRTDLFISPLTEPIAQPELPKNALSSLEDGLKKGVIEGPKIEFPDSGFINEDQVALLNRFNEKFKEIGTSVFALSNIDLFKTNAAGLQALLTSMTRLKQVGEAVADTLAPAFQSLFSAIQQGENPLKAFFQTVQQQVNQLLTQIFVATARALILAAITGGQANIGKAILGALGFKAEGGPVFANKPYVVGEKGPELFIPQGGGRIIPNNEMNSGLAGIQPGMVPVTVTGRLRGRDIILSNARENGSQNRNF